MNKKLLLLAVVVALLAFLAKRYLFLSESEKVRARVREICAAAKLTADESTLTRMGKIKQLTKFFTEDIQVVAKPESGEKKVEGKQSLIGVLTIGQEHLKELEVTPLDDEATVDGGSARVSVTLKATGILKTAPEKFFYPTEALIIFQKIEGEWKVARAEQVHAIQK